MADLRTSFAVLENASTQAGLPLHKRSEGESPSSINGIMALAYKDSSGNLVLPQLSASGAVPVTLDATGQAKLSDEGGVVGSTSFQDLCSIVLVNDAIYSRVGFSGSCFRDALYEIYQIDDIGGTPVETIHMTFRTGAGELTEQGVLETLEFTAGSTGSCELRIRAKLTNPSAAASDIDGMLTACEQQ